MPAKKTILVFVHGWSVTNTSTYGGLPARLRNEAAANGTELDVRHIFLGRYVSFRDEVRLPDVSRAFDAAVAEEIRPLLSGGRRFACITHSTGGPVVRDWWHRYFARARGGHACPMSHLVMLAPANHGSALAQLGKQRISRLKSWFQGVEPGEGVLDWLELGSAEAWDLNVDWIRPCRKAISPDGIFPFVLTGQTVDRKFYDHLNTYTGESGSDGVVRVAAANLNCRLVELLQVAPRLSDTPRPRLIAPELVPRRPLAAPVSSLRLIPGAAHSGRRKGIMRSVNAQRGHAKGREVVNAILDCLAVDDVASYRRLAARHAGETDDVQREERLETEDRGLLDERHFVHDRYAMVVFRVRDDHDYPVDDFDLLLTGQGGSPDKLPKGFFMDRQRNRVSRNTVTYYFNYDIMVGAPAVIADGELIRAETGGVSELGLRIMPRPAEGFVHYLDCEIQASRKLLDQVLQPNRTTLVDIVLRRVVSKNVFRLARMQGDSTKGSFRKTRPGDEVAD